MDTPNLHPLNQAAEMLLRNAEAPRRHASHMALIRLAEFAVARQPAEPPNEERMKALQNWALPKWQNVALLIIEKHLTSKKLLTLSAAEAGDIIANLLLEDPKRK